MKYSLREGKSSCVYWFIEKVILFKLSFFKNNPKANFLLLRSLYISFLLSLPFILFLLWDLFSISSFNLCWFKVDKIALNNFLTNKEKYVTLFTTALGVIYWKLKEEFQTKWKYLMDIAVKINEIELSKEQSDTSLFVLIKDKDCCSKVRKLWNLKFCLVMDAIHLDLWMHKSFKSLYITLVERSIYVNYEDNSVWQKKMLARFQAGKFTQGQLYSLLEKVYNKI